MIARWIIVGFLLWLAITAGFYFGGNYFFIGGRQSLTWAFLLAPILMFIVTWGLLKVMGVESGDQAEAASVMTLPGLAIGTYEINNFGSVFPHLDPNLSHSFAALMFLCYGAIIATGILSSRLIGLDSKA